MCIPQSSHKILLSTLCVVLLLSICTTTNTFANQQISEAEALVHAQQLLGKNILIDGHNDLPWTMRMRRIAGDETYDLNTIVAGDTDIPRMRKGMIGAQFWSVWVPGTAEEGNARTQLEQIDLTLNLIEEYAQHLSLALSADDIERAFAEGKIASLLGMEGGKSIENSMGALRAFYRLGVRYMTLTHNETTDWADSATDKAQHNGLNKFGKAVLLEMNRLGMMIDLAHVSPQVMLDTLDTSKAPVIFSHSAAKGLTQHPRNVQDDVLARLSKNGGLVMTTFIPAFVLQSAADWDMGLRKIMPADIPTEELMRIYTEYSQKNPPPTATLQNVADHIEYIRDKAGIDHVGIGSDFWGSPDEPEGLRDVSRFPYLFAELIMRGWSDADLIKLAGGNILRVMRSVETTAKNLQKTHAPSQLRIEKMK